MKQDAGWQGLGNDEESTALGMTRYESQNRKSAGVEYVQKTRFKESHRIIEKG